MVFQGRSGGVGNRRGCTTNSRDVKEFVHDENKTVRMADGRGDISVNQIAGEERMAHVAIEHNVGDVEDCVNADKGADVVAVCMELDVFTAVNEFRGKVCSPIMQARGNLGMKINIVRSISR